MQSSIPESAVEDNSPQSFWAETWYFFKLNRGALLGLGILILFTLIALFSPWISPHDPSEIFTDALRKSPAWSAEGSKLFLLGTDDVGRDVASRLIYGARVSLGVGALVVILSTLLGTALGLISGYAGGWIDQTIMRTMDVIMALPSMLLAVVVVAILGPGLSNAVLAVSLVAVPGFVRLVRATVLSEKNKQYVAASRSFGASHTRQLVSNILPNCMAPLIVQATLSFSDGILNVAALGFLGLGAQPPTAEWGTMLSDARPFIESAPWLVTLPGLCILIVVLSFNVLGDGLRDALDPRLKR